MTIAPNRAVAVLTPLVFAPLAGAVSVWAASHAGIDIDAGSLQAIFIAGATVALAKAALWLKGWQDWEKVSAAGDAAAGPVDAPAELAPDPEEPEETEDDFAEDIPDEDALRLAA
jgi:hypothetical protein